MSTSTASVHKGMFVKARRGQVRSRIGIDVDDGGMRLAQLAGTPEEQTWQTTSLLFRQGGLTEFRLSPDRLRQESRAGGLAPAPAICAITSPIIDLFPLNVPVTPNKPIELAVVAQVREQLSYPLEEAVIDFAILPKNVRRAGSNAIPVLAFALPRGISESLLRVLDSAKLTLTQLVTPACVLGPAVRRMESEARHLIIATSERATSISVAQDGHVLLERILPWSLMTLVDRLRAELGLSDQRCRSMLMGGTAASPGWEATLSRDGSDDPVKAALNDILGPVLLELSQEASGCIGYCNSFLSHKEISSVLLVGCLAAYEPLIETLRQGLDLPVIRAHEGLGFPGWGSHEGLERYATAAACALWEDEEEE